MGSYKERKDVSYLEPEGSPVKETRAACIGSVLASVAGGIMLGWWEYRHHPTYSQLWMVPFGLLLFATPMVVWFSVFVSNSCDSEDDGPGDNVTGASQPVHPLGISVPAKKYEQWSNHVDHV